MTYESLEPETRKRRHKNPLDIFSPMEHDSQPDPALVSFFLGPVQTFISTARTVRDLWTGSYLLSWLTLHAFKPVWDLVKRGEAEIVSPTLDRDHPLLKIVDGGKAARGDQSAITPCIPNNFKALIHSRQRALDLNEEMETSCRNEWSTICRAVHGQIEMAVKEQAAAFEELAPGWDRLWWEQVDSFFEIRSVVLPVNESTPETAQALLDPAPQDQWGARLEILAGMMAAQKSIRHTPDYHPSGDVPQKCSLLGTYEQMGPAKLEDSRRFWERFAETVKIQGERVRKNERLCAISLVKRFAWPAFFAKRLGLNVSELSYSDMATVAAALWLPKTKETPEKERYWLNQPWSGQWLHWDQPDQDPRNEIHCPEKIWRFIQRQRSLQKGKPPTYYAILVFDADNLGLMLREAAKQQAEKVSAALAEFALNIVRQIVEKHSGELIYSGGDDTLAFLPAENAVACAKELQSAYENNWREQVDWKLDKATVSAGVAIVHDKEDLRFALQRARDAEQRAKDAGRNALGLCVLRRSGEHTTAVMQWSETEAFGDLVGHYRRTGVSDRWAYKLRSSLSTLAALPRPSVHGEIDRLLGRLEGEKQELAEFRSAVKKFRDGYWRRAEESKAARKTSPTILADFVTLCQSASFIVRGKDDDR